MRRCILILAIFDLALIAAGKIHDLYIPQIPPRISERFGAFHRKGNHESWNYNHPDLWPTNYPTCGAHAQSPVNIATDNTITSKCYEPIAFLGYDKLLSKQNLTIKNNGHTITVKPSGYEQKLGVSGGGFQTFYEFRQLHFHWGQDLTMGSEHSIDSVHFPMEMHLVHHVGTNNVSNGEPITAVLAVLFQLKNEDNPNFDGIVNSLQKVMYPDNETNVQDDLRLFALLPESLNHYYRYNGSFTTPPCTEGVLWTVFATPVPIGMAQIEKFRALYGNEDSHLVNNFRPVQSLNGRKILEISPKCA